MVLLLYCIFYHIKFNGEKSSAATGQCLGVHSRSPYFHKKLRSRLSKRGRMVIKIMENEVIKSKQIVLEPQDEKAHPDLMIKAFLMLMG